MFRKEFLPLAIFSLLVLWLIGSWGASFLIDVELQSPTTIGEVVSTPNELMPTNTVSPITSPTRTPTRLPTHTPILTPVVSAAITPTLPLANTPTSTPVPAPPPPTATPTSEFAWQARVLETTYTGAGTIGVRAAGLKDHPVVLHSDGWQSQPQLTGTKPELGDYSTEFGGLGPGKYTVELVGISAITVTLTSGNFMLVEFRYDFANPPSP